MFPQAEYFAKLCIEMFSVLTVFEDGQNMLFLFVYQQIGAKNILISDVFLCVKWWRGTQDYLQKFLRVNYF
ncbi:hypothetical protein [Calothrix sp. 336/3]|uniref:hypothetical protein n=1 Tax=Calothrix sp. 336/3 TaxID=1337936 RepID=UPI000ACDD5E2|nr:hypothetical protein [Calothrix sp. 336/3]